MVVRPRVAAWHASWLSWVLVAGCYSGPSTGGGESAGDSGDDGGDGGVDGGDGDGGSADGASADGGSADGGSADGGSADGADGADDASDADTDEPPPDGPLLDRLEVVEIAVSAVQGGVSNWRIWGTDSLNVAPLFTVPLPGGDTLVGFTAQTNQASVAILGSGGTLLDEVVLGTGVELRGLAAESDDTFGALLWDPMQERIWVRRFDRAGAEQSSTELLNPDNHPDDFTIGDSRLEYGAGTYGAYYHTHSDSGHEGDTLKWVDAASGAESTGWGWGCSHSMSNVLRYNPADDAFLPACVTDCFPGTSGDFGANSIGGIYLNHNDGKVMDVDAGCNGSVAGELGGAALSPSGWMLVFNAHANPATLGQSSYDPGTMNQDIGIATASPGYAAGGVVWLTDTPGVDEDDASIARWQPFDGDGSEQYVVGWNAGGSYLLARIDASGTFLEGPDDLAGAAQWGRRDDPFRVHEGGDIVWSWFDAPGSTTLRFARLRAN